MLVVDDQEEVHRVTEMVLDDFIYKNKKIDFLRAYSVAEAKEIMANNSDIAVQWAQKKYEEFYDEARPISSSVES